MAHLQRMCMQDPLLQVTVIFVLFLDFALYLCLIYLYSSFPTPFYLLNFLYLSLAKSTGFGFRLPGVEIYSHTVCSGTSSITSLCISSQIYKMGILYIK